MKRFEIETIFDTHSESHYTINKNQAMKYFDEKKKLFKNDSTIKKISLNLVTLENEEIQKEPIEKIERREELK